MDEYRKLVFEERASLNAYGINEAGSLNHLIYYKWLIRRTEIDPFEPNYRVAYLKAFNDTYYICTIALLLPIGKELLPDRLKNRVERPSVVFPLVHLYLSKLTNLSDGIKLFITNLETKFKIEPDWQRNFVELEDAVRGCNVSIGPQPFAQRDLTKEILSAINWKDVTNTFSEERIEDVVKSFARNRGVWLMMLEEIKNAAKAYDHDYGYKDYEKEGIDEDGPYRRIIKVPRKPYDFDGNEISLEPLKDAGVYQFCDELMGRFDELSIQANEAISPSLMVITRPREAPRQKNMEENPLFRENLDPESIANALMDLKEEFVTSQKMGERKFFKLVHDSFIKLKWLNKSKIPPFVKWAQESNIMESTTPHLKDLRNFEDNDTLCVIINKFSEKQANSKYKDKDEFYKLNPQGDRKKKYNKG